jgi:hypothetical protein
MWLYTKLGFFSVTDEPGDPETLRVRARSRTDLTILLAHAYSSIEDWPEVITTPERDYPFRVLVPKDEWLDVLAPAIMRANDYGGFKHHLPERLEWLEPTLVRIWAVTAEAYSHLHPKEKQWVVEKLEDFRDKLLRRRRTRYDTPVRGL